jgi:hypothetical protein
MLNSMWRAALALALVPAALLQADTLVFRDGRRVDGELVGITSGTIEFRERRGSRVLRVERDEVRTIELDAAVFGRPYDDEPRPRPRGLREREVVVPANTPFVDAGIDVREGQSVYFEALGDIYWRKSRKDGPGGAFDMPYNAKLPMPRRPLASLIGKVGEGSTELFFIGDERGPVRLRTSGRLFLGINDDYFEDNRGNFRVAVFY